jgi:very-short-patch-repair endonuclease
MARPPHDPIAAERAQTLRRKQTSVEARLWAHIRRKQLGVRFRRQVPMGPWIVDFACFAPKLVVEVDDGSHDGRDELERTRYLEGLGFAVARFDNRDIFDIDTAVHALEVAIKALRDGEPLPW